MMSTVGCPTCDFHRTMSTVGCPTYDVNLTMSTVRCPPRYDVQRITSNVRRPTYDVQRTMSKVQCPSWPTHVFLLQRDGSRQMYSNFSSRLYPLAQNRGTILMGIAVWRFSEKPRIVIFVRNIVRHVRNDRNIGNVHNVWNISGPCEHCSGTTRLP